MQVKHARLTVPEGRVLIKGLDGDVAVFLVEVQKRRAAAAAGA